jgi:quercetin dioxygenase-like cupin family protein
MMTTLTTPTVCRPAGPHDGRCVVPQPAAAEWHLGSLMIWHLTGADTGSHLSLGEVVVRQGGEPPMHVHAREDETWYVLEGSILFQRGLERVVAGPGTAMWLPRGIAHGFMVQTPEARILHAYTPAGLEDAFRALSTPALARSPLPDGPPDPAVLARLPEVYGAHGVTFVGPPLAAVLAREASS